MEIQSQLSLKERFDNRGFSMAKYAAAKELDAIALRDLLDGKTNGKKRGKARKCVEQLRIDGVWNDDVDGKQLTYDPEKRSA